MTVPDDNTPAPVDTPAAEPQDLASRIKARMEAVENPPAPAPAAPAPPVQVVPETPPVVTPEVPEIEPELADTEPSLADLGLPIDAPEEVETEVDTTTPDGRAFKTLRTELKTEKATRLALETKTKELEAKLAEREATSPDTSALEAKIAEYEKTLSVTKLEMSPAYKAAVEEPYKQIVAKADEIAARYEIDKFELTEALGIADRKERSAKLKDLMVGVDDMDKLEILDLGREVEKVSAKQRELFENADKALAELEAEKEKAEKEALAARVTERKTTVEQVVPHMAAKLPSFKDAILALKDSLADTDFSSLAPSKQVYSIAAGELLPTVLKDRNRIQRDLENALDELKAIKESAPGGGAGGPTSGGNSGESLGDSFAERVKARLQGVA
jgi:hypothetical protein